MNWESDWFGFKSQLFHLQCKTFVVSYLATQNLNSPIYKMRTVLNPASFSVIGLNPMMTENLLGQQHMVRSKCTEVLVVFVIAIKCWYSQWVESRGRQMLAHSKSFLTVRAVHAGWATRAGGWAFHLTSAILRAELRVPICQEQGTPPWGKSWHRCAFQTLPACTSNPVILQGTCSGTGSNILTAPCLPACC